MFLGILSWLKTGVKNEAFWISFIQTETVFYTVVNIICNDFFYIKRNANLDLYFA